VPAVVPISRAAITWLGLPRTQAKNNSCPNSPRTVSEYHARRGQGGNPAIGWCITSSVLMPMACGKRPIRQLKSGSVEEGS
jgi:hypothetical protein